MLDPDGPYYTRHPIGSVEALARTLNAEVAELQWLAQNADTQYSGPIMREKRDGKKRETFDALPRLKTVHDAILVQILNRVSYPEYLMGGIADPDHERGYLLNAERHSGARVLVGIDIENFYPKVRAARIRDIFKHVCCFSPEVAALLTNLCTKNGGLAQGAKTSTALANLTLYREEPALTRQLHALGFDYSRFIDDMNCSIRYIVPYETRETVLLLMRSSVIRAGLKPKRKKQFIATAGRRMRVNQLNVNGAPSRPKDWRKDLRATVFNIERLPTGERQSRDTLRAVRSAAGRIKTLALTNMADARRLAEQLHGRYPSAINPLRLKPKAPRRTPAAVGQHYP